MKKFSTIAVHDAEFHADDLFATAVMLEVADKRGYETPTVLRLRYKEDLIKADVVMDVGGVYDPEAMRFDHHQAGYKERRPSVDGQGIGYASFGLVWKHFGQELCTNDEVYERVDRVLVQPIDAHDTGETLSCEYKNEIKPLFLRDMLYRHRPLWNESATNTDFDKAFHMALVESRSMLKRVIQQQEAQIAASELVKQAYEKAADKRVIEFSQPLPFVEQICKYKEPLFVIFKDVIDRWQVRGVPIQINKLELRKQFPEAWAGARYPDLEKISGVADALNCSLKRFVVTTKTLEAAHKIVDIALKD